MSFKRNISLIISELYSFKGKISVPCYGLRVIMYHSINAGRLSDLSNDPLGIFTVHPQIFKKHVQTLVESSIYSLVSFKEGFKKKSNNRQYVSITFDDGYKDNLYTAAPLLVENKIPFTVFITTKPVINGEKDFLTPCEIRELSELPKVEIGSHGVTHSKFTKLGDKELNDELVSSKHYLEDIIGKEIHTISYPHGAVNARVKQAIMKAGYKLGGDSCFGVNKDSQDPLAIKRTVIKSNDSQRVFLQKIKGDWDWYEWAEPNYQKLKWFFQNLGSP